MVYAHTIEAHFVQQSVDRAKRAHDLAEKAAAYYASGQSCDQDHRFKSEQSAQLRLEFRMSQQHRDAALKCTCRTYVFAECLYAKAEFISDNGRYKYYEHCEHHILNVSQRFIYALCGDRAPRRTPHTKKSIELSGRLLYNA